MSGLGDSEAVIGVFAPLGKGTASASQSIRAAAVREAELYG